MTPSYLDVIWLTICGILVFIMQAGFLCLEAGSTRSKNRINITVKNLTDLGLSVLVFWAVGYGFMFGDSVQGGIGVNRFLPNLGESSDTWTGSFFLFQAMFCSTAVTILSGATAERIQFRGYLAIAALISGIIYPIFGHWVWQGIDRDLPSGWLAQQGFVDFAGSTVVHSLGGWCSLATILVIGPRLGRFSTKRTFKTMNSTDIPVAFLGTMLLWFGWFGFNGGSNLIFDAHVSNIIVNTLMAGAAGTVTPIAVMACGKRPIEVTPMMNGSIAGLVAVTAGCHAFSSASALTVGSVGSLLMMWATHLLIHKQIDDVVGAIPAHLAAGIWGTLAVGLFGNLEQLNTGLGRLDQIKAQVSGALACGLWAFSLCLIGVLALRWLGWLRVSAKEEYVGLNISEHGASSKIEDVYSVMRYHVRTGDLKRRVSSDAFTEVGRVGQWYNQVIAALEAAVATNEAIINTALDGIVTVTGDDLNIKSANPAVARLFGQLPEAAVGQPLQHLFASTNAVSQQILSLVAGSSEANRLMGRHRSGEVFPIEITATEASADGERFFTVFLKDISARQQAEDALLESRAHERAKAIALENAMTQLRRTQAQLIQRERIAGQGQLVAGIAHQINNPTNFIYGNLDHAQQYVQDLLGALEKYQEHAHALPANVRSELEKQLKEFDIDYIASDYPKLFSSMLSGTDRIRVIVEQLRNFSRFDEATIKSIDFHSSLDSALVFLADRLEATDIRPAIKISKKYGKVPEIECYASALNRAVLNILCNAIDAFDRAADTAAEQESAIAKPLSQNIAIHSPQIVIKTEHHQGRLRLTISNNGPHICEAEKKQIFDPFFTTQPVGQGTGLGCTISYQIVVEQHHGTLNCYSKKGKGTGFVIELPMAQAARKQA